jgi:hypothetical protein
MSTVADEAWVATALLHREQPEREAFTVAEILERARLAAGGTPLRPGLAIHVSSHAVANKRPNPGRTRMLYATGHGQRRLFRTGDYTHPERTGRSTPNRDDLPERYRGLLDWYRETYDSRSVPARTVRERAPSFDEDSTPSPRRFESAARVALSRHLGVSLAAGSVPGVPKRFDFISPDGQIVGDAKFLTLVGGVGLPPAKFSNIAEHVWLLEKTGAPTKVLVFGNDRRVPAEWLHRYGHLAADVRFYFLNAGGELEDLTAPDAPGRSWSELSSSAFARDWESVEDSVYDELPAR